MVVFWKDISDEVIQRVISRGEIFASAGGFRVEDPDLNPLILDIEGSIDSVMGLPVSILFFFYIHRYLSMTNVSSYSHS